MGEWNYQEGQLTQVNMVHLEKMASGFQAAVLMSGAIGEVREGVIVLQLEPNCLLFSSFSRLQKVIAFFKKLLN